ncbi:unnamed protein product [Vitrella brassicaformis CCMP3155]|uniref:Mediator of RNA polymerase II transcription subunit 7 n=1 Tax=Vitrella brassicaformis (strain CCMP3155) TaxID=1169540 RepID=A0A0G4EAI4_VITBC|nr:unnamed protein product [Vitrella brassicaformis CCMP3155]|eukprot:CEL92268.1 unnamed protein product [Vitrella brassicaformis CCMP3155]
MEDSHTHGEPLYADAYPPPPIHYKIFHSSIDALPPPASVDPFWAFGQVFTTTFSPPPPLDSVTNMLSDAPDADLREEMRRLVDMLPDEIRAMLDALVEGKGRHNARFDNVFRILQNLASATSRLQRAMVCEEVVRTLRREVEYKRALVDRLKGAVDDARCVLGGVEGGGEEETVKAADEGMKEERL